ncbi:hypothetical protein KRR55_13335 [Paeniglutamicibacter sp. ABSL32-1]|uniref:hypothetical protein n=1 Tax=Paeniglutamicibacter quisquiliarum TaxID=2849498 RepID=UPI001C2D331F|nr:hypothetical protein [Paeniglutamicibacter quisquiliarum]MBV1780095.1 hypothetical protein [Paeniglutamicibacter quisquiliarum]
MTDQPAPTRPKNKRLIWIIALVAAIVVAGIFVGSRIYAANVSARAEAVPTLSATATGEASKRLGRAAPQRQPRTTPEPGPSVPDLSPGTGWRKSSTEPT